MAITNYNELKASIASWLARDDLTANIPDFITLFEASAARKLRVRPMEVTGLLEPDEGEAELPSDFLSYRRLTRLGETRAELVYVHPTYLNVLYPTAPSGLASHFTIEGGYVIIRPTDDTDLEIVYLAKNAAVSETLNWLFDNHPDLYLFGALAEAHGFNVDQNNLAFWVGRRDQIFEEITQSDFRERSGMAIRLIGATP